MKKYARPVENLLLTLLLLGGMIGIYLYAGQQESVSAAANSASADAKTAEPAEISEVSKDGRLYDAVLLSFSDAGYTVTVRDEQTVQLVDASNDLSAEMILSRQGDRVNGLTIRVPLPSEPKTKKTPTLTEQALMRRYEKDIALLKKKLPHLLQTAVQAIDPYGEVPSTARLYWEALLLEAAAGDHTASDAGQAIRFRVYEAETEAGLRLCLMLQIK